MCRQLLGVCPRRGLVSLVLNSGSIGYADDDSGLYNASKAALLAYSETLRLELAPFQVKVMTLVTGAVAITTVPQGDIELPPNSLYHKVVVVLRRRRAFEDVPARTPLAEYADTVVKNTLGGASGSVWTGAMASTTWFATRFMPAWILVSYCLVRLVCCADIRRIGSWAAVLGWIFCLDLTMNSIINIFYSI